AILAYRSGGGPNAASAYQGYQTVQGGSAGAVWDLFTTSKSKFIDSKNLTLQQLNDYFNNKKALVAFVTYGSGTKQASLNTKYGIVLHDNHTYFVTSVDMTSGLVTVHNPWGWDSEAPNPFPEDAFPAFRGIYVNDGK